MARQVEVTSENGALVASAVPALTAAETWTWEWKHHGAADSSAQAVPAADDERFTNLADYAGKEVRTVLTDVNGTRLEARFVRVPAEPAADAKPPWPRDFAIGAGVAAALVLLLLALAARVWTRLRESTAQASTVEALPGQVTWPLLTLGAIVLALGLWMVAVEWRVTFAYTQAAPTGTKGPDMVKVVEALSKLKGATLVTLVGLVILVAPTWIAASAAGDGSDGGGGSDDAAVTTAP
jgi:hypothetical protein